MMNCNLEFYTEIPSSPEPLLVRLFCFCDRNGLGHPQTQTTLLCQSPLSSHQEAFRLHMPAPDYLVSCLSMLSLRYNK